MYLHISFVHKIPCRRRRAAAVVGAVVVVVALDDTRRKCWSATVVTATALKKLFVCRNAFSMRDSLFFFSRFAFRLFKNADRHDAPIFSIRHIHWHSHATLPSLPHCLHTFLLFYHRKWDSFSLSFSANCSTSMIRVDCVIRMAINTGVQKQTEASECSPLAQIG